MKAFKKFMLALLALVVLVVGALLIIPFFYSIDSLRPQIQAAIEKQVRGKVELGELGLKLFPQVSVTVHGLKLTPPAPYAETPFLSVDELGVNIPLISFLTGPQATVVVRAPNVHMITRGNDSNLTALLPPPAPTSSEAPAAPQNTGAQKSLDETLQALPSWLGQRIRAARLSLAVEKAQVALKDLKAPSGDHTEMKDLDVKVSDVGIGAPMSLKVRGEADVVMGDLKSKGTVEVSGQLTATPQGKDLKVDFRVEKDLTRVDVRMGVLFHKKADVPLVASAQGTLTQGESISVVMRDVGFRFGGFQLNGTISLQDAARPEKAMLKASFRSSDTNIGPFGALIPMIQEYKLDGQFNLAADASGSLKDPNMNVVVKLNGLTGSTPQLKHPVTQLSGTIAVKGTAAQPEVTIDPLSLKIASSDLSLKMGLRGLAPMAAHIEVSSKRLNADELLGLEALKLDDPAKASAAAPAPKKSAGTPPPAAPLDEVLNEMAPMVEESLKNPFLDQVAAQVDLDFQSIRALGAEFSQAGLHMKYAARTLTLSPSGIQGYSGRLGFQGSLGMKDPKAMAYQFQSTLGGIDMGALLQTHAPSWKGMLSGIMTGDMNLSGRGLRKEQLASSLRGGLKGEMRQGQLSIPVVKVMESILAALPQGVGKKAMNEAQGREHHGRFKTMKLVTVIEGRKVDLRDLDVDYEATDARIGDMRFQAKGYVTFDQQMEMIGTAFLSPDVVRVAELKGPSGKIEIPLKMKGSMADPKPDVGYSIQILGPRIAQNAVKSRAAQEIKKAVAPEIKKLEQKAPEPVKKEIQNFKKKFGF